MQSRRSRQLAIAPRRAERLIHSYCSMGACRTSTVSSWQVRFVKRFGRSTNRLILLSSDDGPILAAGSREAGIRAHLLKPVQQSELLETIRTVMDDTARRCSDRLLHPARSRASDPTLGMRPSALSILVAEDNELNVALLKELLTSAGTASSSSATAEPLSRWPRSAPST